MLRAPARGSLAIVDAPSPLAQREPGRDTHGASESPRRTWQRDRERLLHHVVRRVGGADDRRARRRIVS